MTPRFIGHSFVRILLAMSLALMACVSSLTRKTNTTYADSYNSQNLAIHQSLYLDKTHKVAIDAVESTTSLTLTAKAFLPLIQTAIRPSLYWGAIVDGQAPSTSNMQPGGVYDTFEKLVGKDMAIIHWGQPWIMNGTFQNFNASSFDSVRNHGSIPLIDWGSWLIGGGAVQPQFQLSTIYNGTYDTYIHQWALDAKTWGHPFFLRFDWEMNGTWQFPWAEQINGNQPGDYVKAWRHVHDIFTSVGATNVTWVWCPNISSPVTRSMSSLYPGDAYVDWTCLDGYNQYSTWLGFNSIFTGSGVNWIYDSYQQLLALAPTKPIMIGEFASLEAGDGGAAKAAWITDALSSQIPSRFPAIKAVIWFDWDAGDPANTFPVDSSSASASAFASAIKSQYYDTNRYANFNISPIPPPQ